MRLVVSVLLCMMTLAAKHWYPQGAQAFLPWIVGEEDNCVLQAFSALNGSMEQGGGIAQAVQVFYTEMTGHGVS